MNGGGNLKGARAALVALEHSKTFGLPAWLEHSKTFGLPPRVEQDRFLITEVPLPNTSCEENEPDSES